MRKKLIVLALPLLVAAAWSYAYYRTVKLDRELNPVRQAPPYPVPAEVRALHDRLLIADMHADTLLWDRGLERRSRRGQDRKSVV